MHLISIPCFAVDFRVRAESLKDIGQVQGESGKKHPFLSDPLTAVFSLAKGTGHSPAEILEWDSELFLLFGSYIGGYSRGEQIRLERSR